MNLQIPEHQLDNKPSPNAKSVAFADLPMLLRLRSPAMRFKIPNYGSKWQENATANLNTTDEEVNNYIFKIDAA